MSRKSACLELSPLGTKLTPTSALPSHPHKVGNARAELFAVATMRRGGALGGWKFLEFRAFPFSKR